MKASLQTTMFCKRKAYGLLIIQQNDKFTQISKRQLWNRSLTSSATVGREQLKDIDYRNQRIFTLRCISNRLTPISVKLKLANSKINPSARKIIQKTERQLLQDRVRCINRTIEQGTRGIDNHKTRLVSLVTISDMGKCSKFLDKVREDRYNRVKARQVRKFNNLFSKSKGSILSNNNNNNNNREG